MRKIQFAAAALVLSLVVGCQDKPAAKMDVPQGQVVGAVNDSQDRVHVNVYQVKTADGQVVTVAYDVRTGQTSMLPGPLPAGGKVEVPVAPKPADPKPAEVKAETPKKVETMTITETRVTPPMPAPAPVPEKK